MNTRRFRLDLAAAVTLVTVASVACSSTSSDTGIGPATGGLPSFSAGGSAGDVFSSGGAAQVGGAPGSGGAPSSGGAPGSGGAPSSGGASVAAPGEHPAYDPNVQFDWPETVAQAGSCEPGTYVGTFTCAIDTAAWGLPAGTGGATGTGGTTAASPWQFTGPVKFTLSASQSGEFLQINEGTLVADASTGGLPLNAKLNGKLDCTTNRLEADIVDGTYTYFIFSGAFVGTLGGDLDRLTSTINGTWHLADANNAGSCTGTWSAVKQ